jgi:hypothetical protein
VTDAKAELEGITRAAEAAAAHLDGPGLENAMRDLDAFAERLRGHEVDPDLLHFVQRRLTRFISLCRLMRDVLTESSTGTPALGGYGDTGQATQARAVSLVRRYG